MLWNPGSAVGSRAAALALAMVIMAAACGGATPVSSPTASAVTGSALATQVAATSPSAGTAPAASTDLPPASGTPFDPGVIPSSDPLPTPALSEPFAIGSALGQPDQVAQAVVSLLDVMGVGIYTQDGTPVRTGAEKKPGDPWLTEEEVRGLIEMGIADLGEGGGPYTLADLHAALAPLLPLLSLDEFVAAYQQAYTDHPDDLVPQVMLGRPIDVTTPLTRVQLWLLIADGFVGPADASTGSIVPGALLAQAGTAPAWGTANGNLPPLANRSGLDAPDWRELQNHLLVIAYNIPFTLNAPPVVHEGHGGPGNPVRIVAQVGVSNLASRPGWRVLLDRGLARGGIPISWKSDNESVLASHGHVALTSGQTDGTGASSVVFSPIAERANGAGTELFEYASLYAEVSVRDLVAGTPDAGATGWSTALGRIQGTRRTLPQGFVVSWHETGYYLVTISWSDFWNGVEDHAEFTGAIDSVDRNAVTVPGGVVLTGTGTVTGTRAAWAACSDNLDPPDVAGRADFVATVIGDEVTVAAFSVDYPSTESFTLSNEDGTKTITSTSPEGGERCPHGWKGTITLTKLAQP